MKTLAIMALGLATAGCIVPEYREGEWPATMPSKDHYSRIYTADEINTGIQEEEEYYTWVIRFYKGGGLTPGWNQIQESLTRKAPKKDYALASARLTAIGQLISGEWAKDNSHRRINSQHLQTWAGFMAKARKKGLLCKALDAIEKDVIALIQGDVESKSISRKRYKSVLALSPHDTASD